MAGIQEQMTLEDAPSVSPSIGIEKKCKTCGKVKKVSDFYKHRLDCKACRDGYCTVWRHNNQKKVNERNARWKKNNRDKVNNGERKYRATSEKYKERQRRESKKRYKNLTKKLNIRMGNRMREKLKQNKGGKRWEDIVGYSIEDLKKHLKKQFSEGMTWNNYGYSWHIDHKIPVSAFNFERMEDIDFKRCWSLKNLQPLWAKENMKKHNKISNPFQPSLLIGG